MQHAIRSFYLLLFFLLFSLSAYAQAPNCPATVSPADSVTICTGETTDLAANEGPGLTYLWFFNGSSDANRFPNGNTSRTLTGILEPGDYYVRVTGGDCQQNISAITKVKVVPQPARPLFFFTPADPAGICSTTEITFNITVPEADATYEWNFGDGTILVGNPVKHTYAFRIEPYAVTVRAVKGSCVSLPSAPQTVTLRPSPNFTPADVTDSADFNVCVPKDSTIKVRAKLFNNITQANAAQITGYRVLWTPDGTEETYTPAQFTPTAFIRNPVLFDTTGTFPIRITAVGGTGPNDCSTPITLLYQVNKEPTADFEIPAPPEGKRRLNPDACTPVIVAVTDSSKGGDLTYRWAVQDNRGQPASGVTYLEGTTPTSRQPRFQFDLAGRYQIQLIVSNNCSSDTTSQSVLIAWPEVRLQGAETSCGPTTINFTADKAQFDLNLGREAKDFKWVVAGNQSGYQFVNNTTDATQHPSIQFNEVGVYVVSATFANECGNSRLSEDAQSAPRYTVTINPIPAAPTVTADPPTICAGETATIRPTGPAGNNFAFYAGPTGGTPLATAATYSIGSLQATTTFYLTSINASNCESTGPRTPYTVTVYPRLENNTITQDQALCQGSAPAQITGTAPTGGTGSNYTYQWLRSVAGPVAGFSAAPAPSTAASYTPPTLSQNAWYRRIVFSGACKGDTSNAVAVTITPRIVGNRITGEQQVCSDETVAPLVGNAITGGTPGAITIQWRSNTIGPNAAFSPAANNNTAENYEPGILTQTTWFRRYVVSGGCVDSSNVVRVTVDQAVADNTIEDNQELCSDKLPAPLTGSTPTGGTLPLRFRWESSTTSATAGFQPAAGTNTNPDYNPAAIRVTTWFRRAVLSGACDPNYSNVVQVTVLSGITNNTIRTTAPTVCETATPQPITGSVPTGGNGTYTYLWESSITNATTAFAPAPGTNNTPNYTPPVLDRVTWFRRTIVSGECTNTSAAVQISVTPLPAVPVVQAANVSICPNGKATLTVTGPGGRYQWFSAATGGNIVFEGATFVTSALAQTTTFYVQAVNQNNCVSAARTPVTVNVTSITTSAGRDTTLIEGSTKELIGQGGVRYQWEPAAGLDDPTAERPIARPTKTTTYRVTAFSAEGCTATDEVTITVIPRVVVVNSFSPNHDGINETWEIQQIENYPEATVEIFNRWGTKVFTSDVGYKRAWDGKHNGQDLPLATYYYIIRLDKTSKPLSGNVTLVR